MMRGRNMTTGAMQRAWVLGLLIVFFLPKRVECGYPGGVCALHQGRDVCTSYEVEPLGFYGIEMVLGRDVGFAYSRGDDCR